MRRSLFALLVCLLAGSIAAGCGDDDGGTTGEPVADECKRTVQAAPQLPEGVRDELNRRCDEGAKGGAEASRQATREVCLRVIEESLPAGPALDQAKRTCSQPAQ